MALACCVDRAEALRYLGYRGQELTEELKCRIDAAAECAERELRPDGVFAVYPVRAVVEGAAAVGRAVDDAADDGRTSPEGSVAGALAVAQGRDAIVPRVELEGASVVLEGFSIVEHLSGAREVALMAVTLGACSEQRLRRLSALDPLDALLYDAACSSLVEAAVDALEDRIVSAALERGLVTSSRFSPGYGDLPLEAQPAIVRALRADVRLGLTVLPTNLLLPTKSVTAVVGLFDGASTRAEQASPCSACRLRASCEMRKRGVVCHGRTR